MPASAFLISQKRVASFELTIFRIGSVHLLPSILNTLETWSASDIWVRLPLPAAQAIVAFGLKYLGRPVARMAAFIRHARQFKHPASIPRKERSG
jgi:hypothetical protein